MPLGQHLRSDIEAWIPEPKTPTNVELFQDDISSVADVAITVTGTSRSSENIMTPPPSTINSQDDDSLEAELFKTRYCKAKRLMDSGKYKQAVPYLRRTLEILSNVENLSVFQETRLQQKVQFLLAKALMDDDSTLGEAEVVLQELLNSASSKPLEVLSAAHLLASIYFFNNNDDYSKAKTMCLTAVKGRRTILGRTHSDTYQSIYLLAAICQRFNDSDAEVWQDMLPKNFEAGHQFLIMQTSDQRTECSRMPFAASSLALKIPILNNGRILRIAFTPDCRQIGVLLLHDGCSMVELWDMTAGRMLQQRMVDRVSISDLEFSGYIDTILPLSFLPEGSILASATLDRLKQFSEALEKMEMHTGYP